MLHQRREWKPFEGIVNYKIIEHPLRFSMITMSFSMDIWVGDWCVKR
jgi:hypothetical protein